MDNEESEESRDCGEHQEELAGDIVKIPTHLNGRQVCLYFHRFSGLQSY